MQEREGYLIGKLGACKAAFDGVADMHFHEVADPAQINALKESIIAGKRSDALTNDYLIRFFDQRIIEIPAEHRDALFNRAIPGITTHDARCYFAILFMKKFGVELDGNVFDHGIYANTNNEILNPGPRNQEGLPRDNEADQVTDDPEMLLAMQLSQTLALQGPNAAGLLADMVIGDNALTVSRYATMTEDQLRDIIGDQIDPEVLPFMDKDSLLTFLSGHVDAPGGQ